MLRIILVILVFGFPRVLYAQVDLSKITHLLDSASNQQYVDFEQTEKIVSLVEEQLLSKGKNLSASHLIRCYAIRIESCIAFERLQPWRQNLNKINELLAQHKGELGAEYKILTLRNDLSLAQYYIQIYEYSRAYELFVNLQNEYKRLPQSIDVCKWLYIIGNELATLLFQNGEYEASVNQFISSIPYYECSSPTGPNYSCLILRNVALVYFAKRDYSQTEKYLELAEDSLQVLMRQTSEYPAHFALSLYETQSSYYAAIGKLDLARSSILKALSLVELKGVTDVFRGRIYLIIGDLYFQEDNLTAANKYYNQAETYFLKSTENQPHYLSSLYLSKAELLKKQKQFDGALEFCRKAIEKMVLNFKPDADGNPSLQGILSKKQLFKVLQKKSRLQEKLFFESQEIAVLTKAFNTNQLSLALLDSTSNEYGLDKDKIILSEQSYSAFEDGIRISNTLYQKTGEEKYFTHAISLIEKSKGNLLLENLRLVNRFSGIKQEWLEQEKELKAEMLLTEQALYESELSTGKPNDLQQLRERYASIKRDYSSLIEQIKREAPDYYKLRFDHSVVSPEAIQNELLKPGEALIEFFVGDSILAVAGFTKEKKYLTVKKMLPDFAEKMNRFRKLLTTTNSDFSGTSHEFYNFLLKDCLTELGPEIRSLIIIPDGLLGYLPFEVLIQSKDSKVVYLNHQFSIRYANSATYLMEQMNRQPSNSKNFFAGFVSSGSESRGNKVVRDKQWATLPGAEREVASITELFSSKFTTFNPANKRDFINHASDYKILHFAMHSSVNDDNPMMSVMVFSEDDSVENLLTAIELYSMKLNSEMAVLSACNTGVGQLHRGEGIMSFSRAFAYAGVPSAVISLWKVPDVATSKIMVSFYTYLKKGEAKDKALQLARQDFIRNNPEMSHPYFWSGFILTGNAEPIDFPASTRWTWIVAALLLVLAGLYFGRMRLTRENRY